ncbi:Rne/Rng family ribonuclease [Trichlorobacter ammonificans]|uniref:Ribonuclease G n=1 Tax=Trichlorobacter ammonificans TaxID=2916410 RepID=A0ABM9D7Q2_9BACT|nr:Rne/Rng family ribonuclease [Trichlorobacter ammonificans]CAH2030515.1 Ribonuclease E [Trichlorobacter ammonificans]
MSRKMLINVMHPEEARVAIVQDGRLMELNIEISGKEQTKGNIYKGVVLRVEPGLQAAFVDIGQKKPGFIQMGDLHPDSWQWREDIPEGERKRRPRIQEVLRRGQELIVQVEKDARDMKGAALTGYLSLPGRYMVLMPGDTAAGISRKIEDNASRKELKALVAELQVPEGYGYIVRTEALGRTAEELKKDLEYLLGVHKRIMEQAAQVKGPAEIYRDAGVILRTIRDYFSNDIDEVLVDDKAAWQQAVDSFKELMPGTEKLVKLHKEKRPIFSKYQLEEQIDQLYEKRVPLPSGGSLVIEPTEALVSIDVNSGKSSGERGVEDTAFKTNLEAAAEVARQLRLRDLGGLVVIDFIDMRETKHNKEVEQCLKEALKMDKARMNLGRISQFGMLEMSRQRIAKNINDAIHLECPHCEGRGRVKSVEAMALSFLRKVHAVAAKGQVGEVRGGLPLEVAYFLLNRKKRELAQIENDYEIVVTIKGKPSFLLNQLELEVTKREKPQREEDTASEVAPPAGVVEVPPTETAAAPEGSGKKKRKRKRRKKGGAHESHADAVATEEPQQVEEAAPQPLEPVQEGEAAAEESAEAAAPKKKRRSRSRKKTTTSEAAAVPLEIAPVEPPVAEEAPVPVAVEESRRDEETGKPAPAKKKKAAPAATRAKTRAAAAPVIAEQAVVAPEEVAPPKPVRPKKAAPKKTKTTVEQPAEPVVAEAVAETAATPAPKPKTPRKRAASAKAGAPSRKGAATEE